MSNHQCATPMFQLHWLMNQFTASRSMIGLLYHLRRSQTISHTSPASAICCRKNALLQHADQRERAAARSEIGRSTTSWNTQANGTGGNVTSGACWNGAVKSTTQWANRRKKKRRQNSGGQTKEQLKRRGRPTNIKESKLDEKFQSSSVFTFFLIFSVF